MLGGLYVCCVRVYRCVVCVCVWYVVWCVCVSISPDIILLLFFLACPWSAQETARSWASQPYDPHHLAGRSPPAPSV